MSHAVAIKPATHCQQLLVENFIHYLIVYSPGVKQDWEFAAISITYCNIT
jgi:hypothetical protein